LLDPIRHIGDLAESSDETVATRAPRVGADFSKQAVERSWILDRVA
jgi:hypothetical protein